jgi:hypothetical protein
MLYRIKYYSVENGASIFGMPQFTHEEIIEAKTEIELQAYIEKQKDEYGHRFKKFKKKGVKSTFGSPTQFGFAYTSNQGAVNVLPYLPPKIKKI